MISMLSDLQARHEELISRRKQAVQRGILMQRPGFFMDYEERELDLIERIARLESENESLTRAIDEEMVSCHIGVFNRGDDPIKAIKSLMQWSQGIGEYFAKDQNRCGDVNGIFVCNLPKGHAESHQDVNENGNGGLVGWPKY